MHAADDHLAPYVRAPEVLWRRMHDRVVLLAPDGDDVITLSGTGIAVWDALADPQDLASLAAELAAAFDADPAQVAADLAPVLDDLEVRGVVTRLRIG